MNDRAPSRGYLLCASPRSGSTLLCDLLERTRVAGRPASFFRPASIPGHARAWGVKLPDAGWDRRYVEAVAHHGADDTGCFAMRIMWSDMPAFLARLARLYPELSPDPADDPERLQEVFGIDRFVHLERRDKVAEAVSLVIAAQTGLWHRRADGSELEREAPPAEPRYDHDRIAAELDMIETEAVGWWRWFDDAGVVPLSVVYEELAADPSREATRVFGHLGRTVTELPAPGTARLATGLNAEWVERFRAESGRAAS